MKKITLSLNNLFHGLKEYKDPKVIAIILLSFTAAIPFPLVFGTLSLWYKNEGIDYTMIGFLGIAKAPYGLRFLWAPLLDGYKIPYFSVRFGHRKSWLFIIQCGLIASILFTAFTKPGVEPYLTAFGAFLIAFFSASQDVIIDALRIEILPDDKQGQGAGGYVFGYRIGILVSGAGALLLAEKIGWHQTYVFMAAFILIGIITGLFLKEKSIKTDRLEKGWFKKSVVEPLSEFTARSGWLIIILFILLCKLNNATMAGFVNPFYDELGFTKSEIAYFAKIYGLAATLIGGFLGGIIVSKINLKLCLFGSGVLEGFTSLAFAVFAYVGKNISWMIGVVSFDNLVGAIGSVVSIAYLSKLTNRSYTATQYALLVSLIAISRDLIAAPSGYAVDKLGFVWFFVANSFVVIPSLILIKYLPKINEQVRNEE